MQRIVIKKIFEHAFKLKVRNYSADTYDFLTHTVSIPSKNTELAIDRKISKELLVHLERLSLIELVEETGFQIVEHAIRFADELNEVDTDGVKPLITVLENESLYLREDLIESDITVSKLLSHSNKTQEEYYIAPIGNVVHEPKIEINTNSESSENVRDS